MSPCAVVDLIASDLCHALSCLKMQYFVLDFEIKVSLYHGCHTLACRDCVILHGARLVKKKVDVGGCRTGKSH